MRFVRPWEQPEASGGLFDLVFLVECYGVADLRAQPRASGRFAAGRSSARGPVKNRSACFHVALSWWFGLV